MHLKQNVPKPLVLWSFENNALDNVRGQVVVAGRRDPAKPNHVSAFKSRAERSGVEPETAQR
jgi:hypothetical protein